MYKIKIYLIFILLALTASLKVNAQIEEDLFEKLSKDLGLNNTPVITIEQDKKGYLWFGTWVGLYRYDGTNAKLYTVKSTNLKSNKIATSLYTKSGELFIGTLRGGLFRYDYDSDDFISIPFKEGENILRLNIWDLFEDKFGNIWVATEKGIAIYDRTTNTIANRDAFLRSEVNTKRVQVISDCSSDYIWVGTDDGLFSFFISGDGSIAEMGHYQFNLEDFQVEQSNFIFHLSKDYSADDQILVLCKGGLITFDYSEGFQEATSTLTLSVEEGFSAPRTIAKASSYRDGFLIGTEDGLQKMELTKRLVGQKYIEGKIVRTIFEDSFGSLWIGTDSGLYKYNSSEEFLKNIEFEEEGYDLDILEYMAKSPLSQDIWLGWQSGYVSRISKIGTGYDYKNIEHYKIDLGNKNYLKNRISQIGADGSGTIWIATQGNGLVSFEEKEIYQNYTIKANSIFNHMNGLMDDYLMSMCIEEDNIWVGSWNNGIQLIDKKNGVVRQINIYQRDQFRLTDIPVIKIEKDINSPDIFYVGMRGAGVYILRYDPEKQYFNIIEHLNSNNEKDQSLTNDFITDLFIEKEKLYICSENGLDIYDLKEKKILEVDYYDQLPRSILQALVKVNEESIWLSTYNDGFIEIRLKDNEFDVNTFNYKSLSNYASASRVSLNESYLFGGANGFTVLDPSKRILDTIPPVPLLTEIRINNELIKLGDELNGKPILNKVISELPDLELDHRSKMISFGISILQTKAQDGSIYSYKLDGFNDDWITVTDHERFINFTNLPYKSYKLRFKAANSDGVWSKEQSINLKVNPPWWLTKWAYLAYFLLVIGIIVGAINFMLIKAKLDHRIKLDKVERLKMEELNQLKLKFYTSISHELRTPLTMIISPLEQLLQNPEGQDKEQAYHFMMRNARKLLAMVNQLLDFRKHESGNLELHLKALDFIKYSEEIIQNFQPLAGKKNITLTFISELEHLTMAFDEDQIEKLYNNLLSNAIKYTGKEGIIAIKIENTTANNIISVSIKDTGLGMNKKDLDHIFDRFYQGEGHVNEGYGLGMSIVKSIIENHDGEIRVNSKKGEGTTVMFTIPINLNETIKPSTIMTIAQDTHEQETNFETNTLKDNKDLKDDKRKLLIVEDNDEIKSYIKANFSDEFEIHEASDGLIGYNIASSELPDIIISDIAMPVLDGLQMTKKLKNNMLTSHIPIVLLTARTSIDFKLDGFDYGASAYVTKPFNMELLKKRVHSLIEYQEVLKKKYEIQSDATNLDPSIPKIESLDDQFIGKLMDYIEHNMSNPDLTVDDMAKALLISRIQLYRKTKAITGQTPNAFLRQVRMKRAAQLLERSDYSISEITYRVGFNDLKYFREKFKETFKMNPSKYRDLNKISSSN